jgi:soluble lytic murein transglycosylase
MKFLKDKLKYAELSSITKLMLVGLIFGYSCSTGKNINAPSIKEIGELKELVEQGKLLEQDSEHQPQFWANMYLLGKRYETKGQSELACPLFKRLGTIEDFPLQQLVKIKTLVNCNTEIRSFKNYWIENQDKLPSYLEKFYSEHFLKFSEELELYDLASLFSATLAKYQKSRVTKESFLKQAVSLAEKSKNEKTIEESKSLLYEYSPRLRPYVEGEDIFHAGRDFERHREFSMARSFYRRVINSEEMSFEYKVMAYNRYRLSFKQQRKRREYVNQTLEMINWLKKESSNKNHGKIARQEYFKTQLKYSRAVWTIDEMEKGRIVLDSLLKEKDLDDQLQAQAHWIIAAMYLEKKDYVTALSHLDTASTKKNLPQDLLEKITWSRGWNKYLKEDYAGSIKAFEDAIDNLEDGSFKNKIRFWLGKAYEKFGEVSKSKDIWQDMDEEESFDYYQILTYLKLGKKFTPITPTSRMIDDIEDTTFRWLMVLEETELSKEYLREKQKSFKKDKQIIQHLPYYQLAGWYIEGIRKYFSLSTDKRKKIKDEAIQYIFPTPFQYEFQKFTTKYDVDPALAYSIARQESAFNQYARSHADAFGLLQLIPEKAREIARKTSTDFKDHNDLYDVSINLTLGSYLLNELRESHDNNFIAFVASYNAGSSVVRKWLKKRYRKDPLEFIEMIPYKETRNYVKMVFRNYVIYKRLLGFDKTISPEFFWTSELKED